MLDRLTPTTRLIVEEAARILADEARAEIEALTAELRAAREDAVA
jgi:hypothetical protein